MVSFIEKIKQVFRTKSKPDDAPEKTDLALSQMPEWIHNTVSDKANDEVDDFQKCRKDLTALISKLKVGVDGLKMHDITDPNLSKYKKDFVLEKKSAYISKINSLTSVLDQITYSDSHSEILPQEMKKSFLEDAKAELDSFKDKKSGFERTLSEFFAKDVENITLSLSNLEAKFEEFTPILKTNTEDKKNKPLRLVDDLKRAIAQRNGFNAQIQKMDEEISRVQDNIVKLEGKIWDLKKTGRFKDVLNERDGFSELLESKNKKLAALLDKMEPLLPTMVENGSILAKEYQRFFAAAIINDLNGDILAEITKLNLEQDQKPILFENRQWLIENFPASRQEILDINNRIKSTMTALKKHVIINEIEDVEEREKYYQDKLKIIEAERVQKTAEITALEIDKIKSSLKKELLVLTGFDVNILEDPAVHAD